MPFLPISDSHAIQEVVFILNFNRDLTNEELDSVFSLKDELVTDFPKAERPPVFQFVLGDAGGSVRNGPAIVASPVNLQSFKRDGSLDWRLHAASNFLVVNCLSYSRWEVVYAQARRYFEAAIKVLPTSDLLLNGIALQYIDVFRWDGDTSEYSAFDLISKASSFLPANFNPIDHLWHLHIGQHEAFMPGFDGKLLNRIHMDSVEAGDRIDARVECTHQLTFSETFDFRLGSFFERCDEAFAALHEKNKRTLIDVLVVPMQQKIGLVGG